MNASTIELTRTVLSAVVQLSYVGLSAYAIRLIFLYFRARLDAKGIERIFEPRQTDLPQWHSTVETTESFKQPDTSSALNLREARE